MHRSDVCCYTVARTTLGEEVLDPGRNIPRAIITTLVVSMLLYVLAPYRLLVWSGLHIMAQ